MKLLFGIKSMNVPGGGAERVLATVVSGLAARGHDVAVLTFDAPGGTSFYPMDARVRRIALGLGSTDRKTGARDFVARLPALRRALRRERPQVAVGFMHSMFVPLSLASVGLRIPMVASEHTVPEYYRNRRWEYLLLVLAGLRSARITVPSDAIRERMPALVRARTATIPNPVAVPAPTAARTGGTQTVLAVGRLDADKDHATLIDAFATLAERFPDWRVRIVGEGNLRGALAHQISSLGLDARVTLAGATPDIAREYAEAEVLAVPSRYESFGMATAEALATGVAVVGFADCPGTNELVRHGENGWLVDGADATRVSAFANGLAALMSDSDLRTRLGTAAARDAIRFDPASVVSAWERHLARVGGIA
ncbi:MAG TPA: glycosyltransferase family 4 protein [Candidatus Krumholzibacteria bacterium]|nr:glycosyltransferase family 4 protein [Candidatus Krumholzibacteria bacterium]